MSYIEDAMRVRPLIEKAVQSLNSADAVQAKKLYPKWSTLVRLGKIDTDGKSGYRFLHDGDGELYSCVFANPEFQANWIPGIGTSTLYVRVNENNAGTIKDPIMADRGMEYVYGLYYKDPDDGAVYLCSRVGESDGSTIVLHYLPHELIGQYFIAQ